MLDALLARVEKPSRYIGGEIGARRKESAELRIALAFPDAYEIGMSHHGYQVLYAALNDLPWCAAERVYAPWPDMEAELRARGLPLFTLETQTPLARCDAIGVTLQYELCATGVLQILDLARVPLRAADRGEDAPLVLAGGPVAANPEPWAPFFDALFIGDADRAIVAIAQTLRAAKARGLARAARLAALGEMPGVYLPHRRRPRFAADAFAGFDLAPGEPPRVRRQIETDLETAPAPCAALLSNAPAVHDRLAIEVMRGCLRGCRFCQAGYFYRPARERSGPKVVELTRRGLAATGHDEVSFLSLSTGDWSPVQTVLPYLTAELAPARVAMSLPSLRVESLRGELAASIGQVRRTGFTIAPEAGTERLRRALNKPIADDEIVDSADRVFAAGWELLKLYFMIGLPTETAADVAAIPALVERVFRAGRRRRARARVNVTVSIFVPKPYTPFERFGLAAPDELRARLALLPEGLFRGGVTFRRPQSDMSLLEAALARADGRVADAVERAYRAGARFAGWTEHFDFRQWTRAFADAGLDLTALATRSFGDDEPLPWSGVDIGVTPEFFRAERDRALAGEITPDCRTGQCQSCGVCGGAVAAQFTPPAAELGPPQIKKVASATSPPRHRRWVRFGKDGPAKWLSHLELVKIFSRALRRADLPVPYGEGFHPLPRLAFGPPLAVGAASVAEWVDLALDEPVADDELAARLGDALPFGLAVLEVRRPPENAPGLFEVIVGFEFHVDLTGLPAGDFAAAVAAFLARDACPQAVTRKNRTKTVDARPLVEQATVAGDALVFRVRHTHSEAAVRPARLAELLLGLPEGAVPPYALRKTGAVLKEAERLRETGRLGG
jgi:radical SAM family uncharacterized protein/radical SAM-linked protein